ncbi:MULTISPECIES: hypothetical protein [Aeromonas]|uniref:hypothetical protein n=1 Tax=Aeromonas TaxID=642 RepID=UPI0011AF9A89|nr:hypothetical protein [Aeromonas caviae]QOK20539.1 hypothetical protein IL332_07030 [Aeromonas caviae]
MSKFKNRLDMVTRKIDILEIVRNIFPLLFPTFLLMVMFGPPIYDILFAKPKEYNTIKQEETAFVPAQYVLCKIKNMDKFYVDILIEGRPVFGRYIPNRVDEACNTSEIKLTFSDLLESGLPADEIYRLVEKYAS